MFLLLLGNYILSPDFVTQYRKLDLNEANVLWDLIHNPQNATVEDVKKVVFDPRAYCTPRKRYFIQCGPLANNKISQFQQEQTRGATSPAVVVDVAADDKHEENDGDGADREEEDVVTAEIDLTGDSTALLSEASTCSTTRLSLASRLVQKCRDANKNGKTTLHRKPNYPIEDLVPLPSSGPSYSEDCPPTLDDMLKIVREVRSINLNYSTTTPTLAPRLPPVDPDQEQVLQDSRDDDTPASSSSSPSSNRVVSNYTRFCSNL